MFAIYYLEGIYGIQKIGFVMSHHSFPFQFHIHICFVSFGQLLFCWYLTIIFIYLLRRQMRRCDTNYNLWAHAYADAWNACASFCVPITYTHLCAIQSISGNAVVSRSRKLFHITLYVYYIPRRIYHLRVSIYT